MEIDNDNSSQASSSTEYDNVLLTNDPYEIPLPKFEQVKNIIYNNKSDETNELGPVIRYVSDISIGSLVSRLLENIKNIPGPAIYHLDATYKINNNRFRVFVFGRSDYQGQFHLMFIAISGHETESDFTKLYENIIKLYELIGYEFKPEFIMQYGCIASFNATCNGLPYFQGSPYQRGYGLGGIFRKIFSWIMPIVREHAMPVAKSVVKEKSATDVVQDTIQGNNLLDSAKYRFGESVKLIKSQLGLQDGEGLYLKPGLISSECIKSELDLFLTPSTNTSIVNGGWFEINPTSSLSPG
ncbi:unnamed protein product [Brachionus calyciflorus]|uniref:MULE transposase domain-containing protein n=1 Tax=Brachionus calyciflorus TaxID=104777 RepID=A0A814FJH9_9BILA|nr:unnamed protein product [Brachionus calyciflorus]